MRPGGGGGGEVGVETQAESEGGRMSETSVPAAAAELRPFFSRCQNVFLRAAVRPK